MSIFPKRWPPSDESRIQLYSLATPNGQKVGVMLEETGLAYDTHLINILEGDQFDEDFIKLNPNAKIPAMIDPNGPQGKAITFMESGAILTYLAEKTGLFLSQDPHKKWETMQWLFFQMASVGPMLGQFGHFYKFAKDKTSDTYAEQRYTTEASRLLTVIDTKLSHTPYLAGEEYSIADIATFPWVMALDFYEGKDAVEYQKFTHIHAWLEGIQQRPAVKRGLQVCGF